MFTKIKSPLWIIVIGCAFYTTVWLMFSKKYEISALVAIFIFDFIIISSTMVPKATDAECKKYDRWFEPRDGSKEGEGMIIAKLTVIWVSSKIKNAVKCPKI